MRALNSSELPEKWEIELRDLYSSSSTNFDLATAAFVVSHLHSGFVTCSFQVNQDFPALLMQLKVLASWKFSSS